MSDLILNKVSDVVSLNKEYLGMVDHIKEHLPAIQNDSENFYKAGTQFKNVVLDVTDLTPVSSLRHILAVIDQTKMALEEAHVNLRKKQIELKRKQEQFDSMEDGYDKDLLEVDLIELTNHSRNIQNSVHGAVRKLSFFVTQYKAILEKMGKTEITEREVELEEDRYHIMTAMKQALTSARTRGGIIDEGNHIYLFDMGINGAVAQAEVFSYLKLEEELMQKGQLPTHDLTLEWLEHCANKFADCSRQYAEKRGFITLDQKSLVKEITDETDSSI